MPLRDGLSNDAISRSAVKKMLTDEMKACKEAGAIGTANTCHALLVAIDCLPAVEADGRWVVKERREYFKPMPSAASSYGDIEHLRRH